MEGQIIVTTEALVNQADEVAALISEVSGHFDNMKSVVNRTHSYWIGRAGNMHRDKYIKAQPDIDVAIRRLKEHVVDLKTMAGVFDSAEREAQREAESLISEVIE